MNYITKNTPSLHPSIIDGLIYFSKKNKGTLKKEQLIHFLGNDENLSELNIIEAAQQLNLKCEFSFFNSESEYKDKIIIDTLIEINGYWYILKNRISDKLIIIDPSTNTESHYHIDKKITYTTLLIINKIFTPKQSKFSLMWCIPSLLKQKKSLYLIFILSCFIQLFALVNPIIFEKIIDKVLTGRSLSNLQVLGVLLVLIAIIEPIYLLLRDKLYAFVSCTLGAEFSGKIYQHLIRLPSQFFNQRQSGQIIARIQELAHIRQFITGSALMMVLDFIFIIVFLSVMFAYSVLLTWITIAALVVYFLFWLILSPMIRYWVEQEYQANADNTSLLTEAINGIETIKITATEHQFIEKWQYKLTNYILKRFSAAKKALLAQQLIGAIHKITMAIILWHGVNLIMKAQLSVGELVAFNMFAAHITQPILRLAQLWQDVQQTGISIRRIGEIVNTPTEHQHQGLATVPNIAGSIVFSHVRFRYTANTPDVIEQLSFSIPAGKFIGITGPSGSGKSTITRLIQRFYTPQQGQIYIDGMDLAIANTLTLRQSISVVLQDNFLFSGTIMENIRLSKPDCSEEDIIEASKLAGAFHFITQLPEGFNTQVGERGSNLSGGQRQRIALARALLPDPRILILDEATSALDYASEAEILANLPAICKNRTVICIAHRLNAISISDYIYVIDKGRILEEGTHSDLLNKKTLYQQLWQQQTQQ
ncbi:type I secretion system permease/ATPase [Proteus mirabilis]|nr:type I secretion system permease/ATPase [Proteus mirabilis]MBG3005121.1 type I secretion system permease/ATPase [Proteus mirabilis]MBG3084608.1 type I secretion system permease/ATPase [Proteus mirabilis]MBG3086801.1 type I secretion system permease/ATPase [Proteus mirabilis]MBG5947558.1 type I secretion system permease/ATPase [Proteus mirabilis]